MPEPEDCRGIEPLLERIRDALVEPGLEALGIVADANSDIGSRWQGIQHRAGTRGIVLPNNPDPVGTIVAATEDTPRVGVWLMPNNADSGELEDFVAQMIPQDDPVWPRSQDYIDRIPAEHQKFAANKTTRAQVYAWLATREDPRQMGLAIMTGDLKTDGILAQAFVHWLNRLFGDPPA
ncbi:MAG: hypothetical protein OXC55_07350 [Chloroflexi bacterium]|nr:hypothetical protein [Chloroflexota bacterium]